MSLEFRKTVKSDCPDVITSDAVRLLEALARFDVARKSIMDARIARRAERASGRQRIGFLDPNSFIPRTSIKVKDAREGNFVGTEIPHDLKRQWIQGTGPAARPGASIEVGLRNVAYALLSGADGWMFDGEDALGQVSTMSLDNQRNLKLAIHQDPKFLAVAEKVASEMNAWAEGFFGKPIVADWRKQLAFTTKMFRPRGLHLDDRHVRNADGSGFSASIVDATLYIANNHRRLIDSGASIVL
jgi:malate synthase